MKKATTILIALSLFLNLQSQDNIITKDGNEIKFD